MVLSHAFCNVSVAPLRRDFAHRSEQTSQLLFGERVEVLEVGPGDWARVRGCWDAYEGWCRLGQLQFISPKDFKKTARQVAARHYDALHFEGSTLWLPMGSELTGLKSGRLICNSLTGKFKGKKINLHHAVPTREAVKAFALQYLHAPYQWGGRTIAGIDCSGLVQMAYKMAGTSIARDASQQAQAGNPRDFLMEAKCGDLAFFDNAEGHIVHVGILLDNQTIIHATDTAGRVVVDKIDNSGIISLSLKRRTHNLRLVKRVLPTD
jgi:cell wall-associated NlpC family hydrolase